MSTNSSFPPFTPISSRFPNRALNVVAENQVYPTNSWMQTLITNNINDASRVANAVPWYWLPSYQNPSLNLSHYGTNTLANITSNGNFIMQESPGHDITVASGNLLTLDYFDDYTAKFTLRNGEGIINAYPLRGSPLATFVYENAPIDITFNRFPNVIISEKISSGYTVTTRGSQVTTASQSMVQSVSGWTLGDLSFRSGTQSLNKPIAATLDNGNVLTVITLGVTVEVILGSSGRVVTPQLPEGMISVNILANRVNPVITYTFRNGDVYSINTILDPDANPKVIIGSYSFVKDYLWYIFTDAELSIKRNGVYSDTAYTGTVQICYSELFTLEELAPFLGNYAISGTVDNFSGGISGKDWTFSVNWSRNGDLLLLFPNVWNRYTVRGMVKHEKAIQNFIYGDLTPYTITGDTSDISVGTLDIPVSPNLNEWTEIEKQALAQRVIADAKLLSRILPVNSDPYGFGTAAAALGRVLVFGKLLGVLSEIGDAVLIFKNSLINWLEGTNSNTLPGNPFQLQYDSVWGGVLVPADYLLDQGLTNVGAFGNSYYNDHHFHWGYLLYSIYCLELIGEGIIQNYKNKIKELVLDICNPDSATFAWKTRHKDWYSHHSWATGITDAVNRQQESSGEAVNGYYAAYLISLFLEDSKLKDTAALCLFTEVVSSQEYYQLSAPGSDISLFSQVAGIGILQTLGKSFSLDWGMQPDSYNGRAIGIYGIQSIPFTEISLVLLRTEWMDRFSSFQVQESYRVTTGLALGLMNGNYTPIPASGETVPLQAFNVQRDGAYWGCIALKMLALSSNITPSQLRAGYLDGIAKQNAVPSNQGIPVYSVLKAFDSFSNTLYWIQRTNRNRVSSTQELADKKHDENCYMEILDIKFRNERREYSTVYVTLLNGRKLNTNNTSENIQQVLDNNTKCYKITIEFRVNITNRVVGPANASLSKKAYLLKVTSKSLIEYAVYKLVAARLLYGNISTKFLKPKYHLKLISDIIEKDISTSMLLRVIKDKPYKNFFIE